MQRLTRLVLFVFLTVAAAPGLRAQPARAAAGPDAGKAGAFLPNDPRFNPWAWPLDRFGSRKGVYSADIHMGFLNTDYFCSITPERGVDFIKDKPRTPDDDVTRWVLSRLDGLDSLATLAIRYGVGDVSPEAVRALLPRAGALAQIQEGKQHGRWGFPQTHAKVLQITNGKDAYYTMHGSLNLQTVGMTCKGNNTLRFVEQRSGLYAYFAALSEAAGAGDGRGIFPGGQGDKDSSGIAPAPVTVGDYQVLFYAGHGQRFVGGSAASAKRPWPNYLNAPYKNQHNKDMVNWYDAALYDAAAQLRQGRDVRLDIAVFEIGQTAWFVDNLFRFINEGFGAGRTEDRTSGARLAATRPGNLTVRFLWQFQSGAGKAKTSTAALLAGPSSLRRTDPATGSVYSLEMALVWPTLSPEGVALNPGTPRDMHNKMMLLDVAGHEEERRIYVTSSNLDTPGVGSGKLWQAGTIVAPRPGSDIWSGTNAGKRHLFNAYKQYFNMLWDSREGQPGAGQAAFHQRISKEHLAGNVNWIETAPHANSPTAPLAAEGIDAFFFPVPIGTGAATRE